MLLGMSKDGVLMQERASEGEPLARSFTSLRELLEAQDLKPDAREFVNRRSESPTKQFAESPVN